MEDAPLCEMSARSNATHTERSPRQAHIAAGAWARVPCGCPRYRHLAAAAGAALPAGAVLCKHGAPAALLFQRVDVQLRNEIVLREEMERWRQEETVKVRRHDGVREERESRARRARKKEREER